MDELTDEYSMDELIDYYISMLGRIIYCSDDNFEGILRSINCTRSMLGSKLEEASWKS
jgi:hypothetical protein